MIVEEIKKSILQSASEGKLTYQKSEENAEEELKGILEDAKDDKKYTYNKLSDIPFNLPDNWIWVKLEDIAFKITDGTHSTPKYTLDGIPFLSVKDLSSGVMNFKNTKFISKEEHNVLFKRCNPEYGDILITKVGTTGIPVIVNTTNEFSLFVSVALIKFNKENIFNKYLYYILSSPVVQSQVVENTRGVGNKNWVLNAIKSTILPLPPLEEQQRIVDKIEELFSKLDEIKPIEEELKQLKNKFPYEIKKSILKSALYGELTEFSKDEVNLKTKNIECSEIPSNWIRTKAKNILNISTGKKDANHACKNGAYLFYTCACLPLKSSTFSFDGKNLILPGNGANVGLTIYCEEKFEAYQRTYVVNSKYDEGIIYLKYIYYYFACFWSEYNKDKMFGSAIPYIKMGNLENFEVNIPPIKEQKQIVEKIEKLLPLCDDIEKLVI